jgi:hypothetical protein
MAENDNNEIDAKVIVSALQFWKKVYDEKEVSIKFTKKDGSTRLMRCTLDFKKVPDIDKPKGVNIQKIIGLIQKNKIIHVYDLDKKAWRSVPFERVEYMDTAEERYYVKPKK